MSGAGSRTPDLVLVHLYPDLLAAYGDRGNVVTLVRRAEWRGFSVRVEPVTRGEPLPRRAELILIGGGSDRIQGLIGKDLAARRTPLLELLTKGATIFGVCAGYQLLGHRFVGAEGVEVPGLGLLDVSTVAERGRLVGPVSGLAELDGRCFAIRGFENHSGRTVLGDGVHPLATVPKGRGNNGRDRTEGAFRDGVIGTYLHGPVLPSSPELADALLWRAVRHRTGGAPLVALSDER